MYIQKINYIYIKGYLPSQCVYVVCATVRVHACVYIQVTTSQFIRCVRV